MKLRAFHILAVGALMAFGVSSCDDKYGDDLRAIGRRVEILEDSLLIQNRTIQSIRTILYTIDNNGYITKVIANADNTYTLTFNNKESITLRDGKDGKDGKNGSAEELDISVAKGEDGYWYWTLNGQWIIGEDGNPMRAGGLDGKDGKDGENGLDGQNGQDDINLSLPIPMVRVNSISRTWEISTDGGVTYINTGVLADGKDGKDGSADNYEINAKKGPDGNWYWTINGEWLYDDFGNRMRANGMDGNDGANGQDGQDDVNMSVLVPKVRINPETRIWEISTDGGNTYKSTGIFADGADGKDGGQGSKGSNGTDGRDDVFLTVKLSADGKEAIITLRNGREFIIPVVDL